MTFIVAGLAIVLMILAAVLLAQRHKRLARIQRREERRQRLLDQQREWDAFVGRRDGAGRDGTA